MNNTVLKFDINPVKPEVSVPRGFEILCIRQIGKKYYLFCLGNPDAEEVKLSLISCTTDKQLPKDRLLHISYLDTIIKGTQQYHIFLDRSKQISNNFKEEKLKMEGEWEDGQFPDPNDPKMIHPNDPKEVQEEKRKKYGKKSGSSN